MQDNDFENKFCFNYSETNSSLDVLLELIKKKKTSIYDIDIKELTDQFTEYFNLHKDSISLEEYSDYANMSAYLVELKTRSLLSDSDLSIKDNKTVEEERDWLIKRLLEHQMYKNAIPLLQSYQEKRSYLFDKIPEDFDEYMPTNAPLGKLPKRMSPEKLKIALENVFLKNLIKERLESPVDLHMSTQEYSLEEVIYNLVNSLNNNFPNGCLFSEYFNSIPNDKSNIDYFCMLFFVVLSLVHQEYLFFEEKNNDFYITLNKNLLTSNEETANFIEIIKKDLFGEQE